MPREGAFHHLIIVSYPRREKDQRKWLSIQHDFMLLSRQVCWLFADRTNMYFKEVWCKGVNEWQGISKKIKEHENSVTHVQACCTYDIWKQNKTVNSLLKCNFKEEVNKVIVKSYEES
ncbi:hypothetical protein TNIN_156391 [Trichonephila inaurata madagascariensis]|uniref:Uncharacterized protein n=1 Tax=Trichonephila inaurata madagascariensis TaxID=2747483 RepID=A0A8X6YLR2_9ARAC|nr:hypothetical protein TNIN_156391 [Trichonephila inaurata madagascariensis]